MTNITAVHLVWFKRDLRLDANAALTEACAQNDGLPTLGLFIAEPDYWALPDTSARQWEFQAECLAALQHDMAQRALPLLVRTGRRRVDYGPPASTPTHCQPALS